jgi:hypothetical protein
MSHIDNPNDEMEERDEDRYQATIAMREAEARGETAALFRTDEPTVSEWWAAKQQERN